MITQDLQTLEISKKRFSEFDRLGVNSDTTKVYLVGYQTLTTKRENIKVSLTDILTHSKGGETPATVLMNLEHGATMDVDGYQLYKENSHRIWVFDCNRFGSYVQVMHVAPEDMQEVTIDGESMLALDFCFVNTLLGNTIRLYLPDFAGEKPYAVRLWRIDPGLENAPTAVNEKASVVLISRADEEGQRSQDWFLRFIVLGHVTPEGLIKTYTRTAEVINIYDSDDGIVS